MFRRSFFRGNKSIYEIFIEYKRVLSAILIAMFFYQFYLLYSIQDVPFDQSLNEVDSARTKLNNFGYSEVTNCFPVPWYCVNPTYSLHQSAHNKLPPDLSIGGSQKCVTGRISEKTLANLTQEILEFIVTIHCTFRPLQEDYFRLKLDMTETIRWSLLNRKLDAQNAQNEVLNRKLDALATELHQIREEKASGHIRKLLEVDSASACETDCEQCIPIRNRSYWERQDFFNWSFILPAAFLLFIAYMVGDIYAIYHIKNSRRKRRR